jgi:hypothetical protein
VQTVSNERGERMAQLTEDALLTIGFRDIGAWISTNDDQGIEYRLDGPNIGPNTLLLNEANALYAFVVGEQVKYIGKTARTIRERLAGYRHPHQRQRTNWRCNAKIRQVLKDNEVLRIFIFNPISHLRYGDFDTNLAAALEDSLIAEFNPPWNGREGGRPITEEAEREAMEVASTLSNPAPEQEGMTQVKLRYSNAASPVGVASFQIVLGEAYYNHGVINPGVEASTHLGADGDPILVAFGDGTPPVSSRINRTANRSGGVRVVGSNRRIAEWFQAHFNKGDIAQAKVVNQHCIMLIPKVGCW